MRTSRSLSALLISGALTFAPVTVLADPTSPATAVEPAIPADATIVPEPAPAAPSDSEQYASREAADQSVAEFQGGDSVTIAGSTLAVVLLVVLLVILL